MGSIFSRGGGINMREQDVLDQNKQLMQENLEYKSDIKKLYQGYVKLLKAINCWPLPEDTGTMFRKATALLPSIIIKATTDPKGLKQQFSFLDDIQPIMEKYEKQNK